MSSYPALCVSSPGQKCNHTKQRRPSHFLPVVRPCFYLVRAFSNQVRTQKTTSTKYRLFSLDICGIQGGSLREPRLSLQALHEARTRGVLCFRKGLTSPFRHRSPLWKLHVQTAGAELQKGKHYNCEIRESWGAKARRRRIPLRRKRVVPAPSRRSASM